MKKDTKKLLDYLSITIGTLFLAISIYFFFSPHTIAPGGVSGFAVVIYKLLNIKIAYTNLAINIPLFITGVLVLGKTTGFKTAFGTITFSGWLIILENYSTNAYVTNDVLLSAIFGGVLSGLAVGMVFRVGGTTGGTDLFGAILNNYFPHISTPKLMMIADLCVVTFAGIVNKKIETVLYSIIALYIIVKVADFIMEGLDYSKMFYIVTDHPQMISEGIIEELGRGVTALKGTGMYTKNDKEVLLCVVNRAQVVNVKKLVKKIDPKAFVMISTTHEVVGEGFTK